MIFVAASPTDAADKAASGHYLFAWAGNVSHKDKDFLAVIDADPESASYGSLVATSQVWRLSDLK